jgi:tetratricopeptide (TPR) repeat protein
VILLFLQVLVLGLVEAGLRLGQYGGSLDLFVPSYFNDDYWMVNRAVGRRYFFVRDVTPATSYDAFLKEKPANGFRVFVLGGSTAAGYPYLYNGAFSRMLADRLRDALPERTVEVVNVAMPAVNSYTLLDLTDEILDYEPDLLLVYAGHNEFYGALGVGSTESLGQFRGLVNLYLKLERYKLFLLLRDLIGWTKGKLAALGKGDGVSARTLMEGMARDKEIDIESSKYRLALSIFRENLRDILKLARERGVDVLLGDVVSNVRDQQPFVSVFKPETDRKEWERRFTEARKLQQDGELEAALAAFRRLAEIDSKPARLHFRMAQVLEGLGRYDEARQAYYRAKDLDGLRFRASEDLNRVIEELARQEGVAFVSVKKVFEEASPHGLVGSNLMLEHLHPNVRGYFLMAKAFAEALCRSGLAGIECDRQRVQPDSVYWAETGVTPLDEDIAAIRILVLTSGWPFQPDPAVSPLETFRPKSRRQELALAFLRDEMTWEMAHVKLAEYYTEQGHLDSAAVEYAALVKGTPLNVSPYLRLAEIYIVQEQYDRAEALLRRSLALEPTVYAHKWLGSLLLRKGDTESALEFLEKAYRSAPGDIQTRYNLSGALALLGRRAEAKQHLKFVLEKAPDHAGAKALWQQLQ